MGSSVLLAVLFWLLSVNYSSLPSLLVKNPPSLIALTLFLLLSISLIYTPIPISEAVCILKKYRELLYFVVIISLLHQLPARAKQLQNVFLAGAITLLALSYAMYFSLIPTEKFGYSTLYHITQSFFMAILAFWILQRVFEKCKYILLWAIVLLLTIINLFYIAPGRTGMVVFILLVLLTFIQHLSINSSITILINF